nr:hypothetical protein [Ardenticatenia bacterium]
PGVSLIAPAEGDDASVFTIKFDNATLENGVTIDGFLRFEQSYDLQFGIANGELDSLLFATTTAETRNIQLHVAVDSPRAGLSKSKVITHLSTILVLKSGIGLHFCHDDRSEHPIRTC